MNFNTNNPPFMGWCVVEAPLYSPSGYAIAQWNGNFWENEHGENISTYVEGWVEL